ncbi:MAG: HAD hydrolase-like protein [Candidatus Paceibacterota bacterium]
MDSQNKKLVIFDFDGVLVDTLIMHYKISSKVNKGISLNTFKSFFEGNIHKAIRFDGTPKIRHHNFNELYKQHTRELVIPEILKNILKNLSEMYNLVIISSADTFLINDILNKECVGVYFQDILGADMARDKTEKIKTILNKYNIGSENSVFVTDTSGDVREGFKCGVKSIAVTWGFHDRKTLENANPIAIIDDPRDLLGAIKNACPVGDF